MSFWRAIVDDIIDWPGLVDGFKMVTGYSSVKDLGRWVTGQKTMDIQTSVYNHHEVADYLRENGIEVLNTEYLPFSRQGVITIREESRKEAIKLLSEKYGKR